MLDTIYNKLYCTIFYFFNIYFFWRGDNWRINNDTYGEVIFDNDGNKGVPFPPHY